MDTIDEAATALASGATTARQLVEAALERAGQGEGPRAFISLGAAAARAQADAIDLLRRAGRAPGRYAGIPVGIKDLFDMAGAPTPAGSVALADAPPANADAPTVARMIAAGFVPIGRTNMTEFAFGGLGINPHHGTPSAPWDRDGPGGGHIPGGSSSGTAVAVADRMVFAGLGTDTGGSCRIPAAFCGVVGYKPTARRVPITGVLPLSPSLDSVGPLARSVQCCATIDAFLAGETPALLPDLPLSGLRLAVPTTIMLDDLDPVVAKVFEASLTALSAAGADLTHVAYPVFSEIVAAHTRTGFSATEAFAWHRATLARAGQKYDPRVRVRIERGSSVLAADYLDLLTARRAAIAAADLATAPFDALVMPTTPILPPPIAVLEADEAEYLRTNLLTLRNTVVGNLLDRCAISLPCTQAGEPPVGLMLMGETMGDKRLFAIARAVEACLAARQ